ncbi:prolipoprotein diacylglyceryl transferase [uncultured Dysgonomonas sp.]|uniref:Phosphatidylglycerol--prolipoprotein diacylglyceryl transferase n=1 Tax=uncultured Dysgonomonas sp. TaxID=206096 RepID=A0A212J1H0_9BACT|nr:prolipoprotein diacylglyceryl transferase [uncultured Dysgonomonas sp.]SBV93318.1 Prolipoprotein diacylglyceryl transferase [uncultured Dysgonomonas sp.]
MLDMLSFITWDVNPEAFSLFGREIRWYGILWAAGVLCTTIVVQKMYKSEKLPEKWFDSLFLYVLTGLVIGARLGHCLFYDPVYYLSNPLKILMVWEGGLASHGGAIGMTIGVCLYSLKITGQKMNWKHLGIFALIGLVLGGLCQYIYGLTVSSSPSLGFGESAFMGFLIGICVSMVYTTREMTVKTLDRLVVGVAIGATSIRLGNLMNSEIYGGPTTLPWGFNFIRDPKWHQPLNMGGSGELPCHPTQIYEALFYLFLFGLGLYLYYKTNARNRTGLILGISLIGIFFSRFCIEFIKNIQEPFEVEMIDTFGINMGQLLSIPFVIWGIWLLYSALTKKTPEVDTMPKNSNVKKK